MNTIGILTLQNRFRICCSQLLSCVTYIRHLISRTILKTHDHSHILKFSALCLSYPYCACMQWGHLTHLHRILIYSVEFYKNEPFYTVPLFLRFFCFCFPAPYSFSFSYTLLVRTSSRTYCNKFRIVKSSRVHVQLNNFSACASQGVLHSWKLCSLWPVSFLMLWRSLWNVSLSLLWRTYFWGLPSIEGQTCPQPGVGLSGLPSYTSSTAGKSTPQSTLFVFLRLLWG